MPILYVKNGCAFCARVLQTVEEMGLSLDIRNIADPGIAEELVAHGGKRQVPYLIDEEHNTALYESDDIIEYLHRTFTANT
ncbi:glutathione S-transferase N-terminal domain-containing protein [Patescibacteria group bacterium]|nr:glutathione S-transferase N-terminal domain-containing protein [Patescibacteria group bacterium]MBU1501004.1 glutathione S-transferase N-terminal domain-containing protein [Patescibacteria group bacterium]MBU2080634.1 glutathione S-transferase N-terminal domain-containing protein [Patescibacteria group bacterium]MBU2124291.1 glutathione S-transferase N-terminal domain-containing protein [Patescibacteria group bacterium]MBU2194417.1 glutathione S-transferase N-terminal domain-containing prote